MVTINHILCPIDFSEFSRHAIDHALAIARCHGGAITALHVIPPLEPLIGAPTMVSCPPMVYTDEDLRRFKTAAQDFVQEEGDAGSIDVVAVIGGITDQILGHAKRLPADLIVMGTHGRTGFDRLMLGSVTERMLRKAPCPVLTVPKRAPAAVPAGPVLFRRLLCAVDFSPSSMQALDYAMSLAGQAGAELRLLHVVEPLPIFEPAMVGGPGFPQHDQQASSVARRRLQEVMGERRASFSGVMSEVLGLGKPYREILRVASEYRSDLLVMGVHGGGSGLLAFGSTTNHVVRAATCPVLTLRA